MDKEVPFLSYLESIWEFVVGHSGFAPGGLSELRFSLFWRFMFLIVPILLFCFEVEIGGIVQDFFRFADSIVRGVFVVSEGRDLLIHL